MAETTFYVQFEPDFHHRWSPATPPTVRTIAAKRVTQARPVTPIPGSVVVKMNVSIPDEAFLPLAPEATVLIPFSHTEPVLVESEPVEVVP